VVGVLALIAELNGLSALLFHVEQTNRREWEYRLRVGGREVECRMVRGRDVLVGLPPGEGVVEADWRWVGDEEWVPAVPHEFGLGAKAEFYLRVEGAELDLRTVNVIRVCGMVGNYPSGWVLDVPKRVLGVGRPETVRVWGESLCVGLGQVLEGEGCFRMAADGGGVSVANVGKSQAALLPVEVARVGILPERPVFFVSAGRVSDEELEMMKKEVGDV
jgi:hypothetical protein